MWLPPQEVPPPRHVAEQGSVLREFQAELIGDKISGAGRLFPAMDSVLFCVSAQWFRIQKCLAEQQERVQGPLPGFVQSVNGRTRPVNSCQYCRYDCTQ